MSRKPIQILMEVGKTSGLLYVGRRTKGKMKKDIPSLKSEAQVSVTSTRGKLEVLRKYYQHMDLVWIVIVMPCGRKRLRVT